MLFKIFIKYIYEYFEMGKILKIIKKMFYLFFYHFLNYSKWVLLNRFFYIIKMNNLELKPLFIASKLTIDSFV